MKRLLKEGMVAPDFTFDSHREKSLRFYDSVGKRTAVLFFLRYTGCPLCQLKISEIIRDRELFDGTALFVALQSDAESIRSQILQDVPFTFICDPGAAVFSLYGVSAGSIFRYLTPSVIAAALRAGRQGFRHGKREGKELQLPAIFVIDGSRRIRFAHYGKNISDLPDNGSIATRLGR